MAPRLRKCNYAIGVFDTVHETIKSQNRQLACCCGKERTYPAVRNFLGGAISTNVGKISSKGTDFTLL